MSPPYSDAAGCRVNEGGDSVDRIVCVGGPTHYGGGGSVDR